MESNDLTTDEVAEFGDVFAELDLAKAHLELAAQKLATRGYAERASKVLGTAQAADAQKYLLLQDRNLAGGPAGRGR